MAYIRRTVDDELDDLLQVAPAIALDGPKGVGKTATAQRRADSTWMFDRAGDREVARADPSLVLAGRGTLLLDEWQREPAMWDAVRRAVDAGSAPGRYLLTGSATPIKGVDTHSGAGRILSLRMRPMALHERGAETPSVSLGELLTGDGGRIVGTTTLRLADYLEAIEASGFPGITTAPARLRRSLLDGYVHRIVDRDLPDQGLAVRRPETLRRWLAAYAAASSSTTAYSRILDATTAGDGTQPAKTTTIAYRDHLTQLWLLDPVHGWAPTRNALGRLQQAPKHQLADPGLAARLLNLSARSLASSRGGHMAGPLFEALATLGVRVAAQVVEAKVGHLRSRNGDREIDLVVEGMDGQVIGIEVKLAPAVDDADVRHLHWLRKQLKDDVVDLVVINTGEYAYRRSDGVAVVPLSLLGP